LGEGRVFSSSGGEQLLTTLRRVQSATAKLITSQIQSVMSSISQSAA